MAPIYLTQFHDPWLGGLARSPCGCRCCWGRGRYRGWDRDGACPNHVKQLVLLDAVADGPHHLLRHVLVVRQRLVLADAHDAPHGPASPPVTTTMVSATIVSASSRLGWETARRYALDSALGAGDRLERTLDDLAIVLSASSRTQEKGKERSVSGRSRLPSVFGQKRHT